MGTFASLLKGIWDTCLFTSRDMGYRYPTPPSIHALLTVLQGSHRLEKYLNLEGFLIKSLKIKYALKSTGK